jgi:protein-S-isoprenylcysteine O-methyltransferase
LTSWAEFAARFVFAPHWTSLRCSLMGLLLVVPSQTLRSLAMATASESFNHVIQTSRKQNHVLVTHGVYRYIRHPSYVGFFFWSIGTQLLLSNMLHTTAFAFVSWQFFKRRIPFEEESLCRHYPDEYPAYMARTWTGIPFLRTHEHRKGE